MTQKILWAVAYMVLSITSCFGQTLHVIAVADTDDPRLGDGFSANLSHFRQYVELASSAAGLALDMKEIIGASYTCDAIKKSVISLHAQDADVIIFYHSGHGLAPGTTLKGKSVSNYPSLDCEKKVLDKTNADNLPRLESILGSLRRKGAHLTFVIADSCNSLLTAPSETFSARGFMNDRIESMFRDFNGYIIMSSSIRGQDSGYTSDGGVFTNKLLNILKAPEANSSKDLWKNTISAIKGDITLNVGGIKTIQKPQADSNLIYKK